MLAKQRARDVAAATQPAALHASGKPADVPAPQPALPSSAPQTPAAPRPAAPAEETTPLVANRTASLTPPPEKSTKQSPALRAEVKPAVPQMELDASNPGDDWERRVLQAVKDHPNEVAPQLNYQLLEFIKGKSVPDMRPMASMSDEDRDVLVGILDAMTNFRSGVRADNNMLQSRKIRPLLQLADRLRAESDLSLPTLTLCRKVEGFGVYDPIEPARFSAGKEHPAIIYCEVANFSSQQNDKKMWSTKISEEEVLYTESGLPIWPAKPAQRTIADQSRNRRHDFFIVKLIRLPATLSVGRYLLKVTVVDQQTNRMAEGTIPIDIVAE
jgi:hypothetical protein